MEIKNFKMKEGEKTNRCPDNPTISIVGKGTVTYLWVGNDSGSSQACYATISGTKTLEKLACCILSALGHDAKSIKKRIYENTKQ